MYEILAGDEDEMVSAAAAAWLLLPGSPGHPANHDQVLTFLDNFVT